MTRSAVSIRTRPLDRQDYCDRWKALFGHDAPAYASVEFLSRVIAHEAQIDRFGGHSATVVNALNAMVKEKERVSASQGRVATADGQACRPTPATLKPGTCLVREWNGRPYRVEVKESGFEMDGRHYASLSAVANRITGGTWSGPRFFGLARR